MFRKPNIALAYAKGRNREMRRDAARYREVAALGRNAAVIHLHEAEPYGSAHGRGDRWAQENHKPGFQSRWRGVGYNRVGRSR
jgi:hypothetical protein